METDFYISYFEITSATNWLRTCACSLGGPGRNRDEQRGGRSTLGTDLKKCISIHTSYQGREKGEGNSTKCYMGRLCSEVQSLTRYIQFNRKSAPNFVYLLLTNGAPNHIPSLELCISFHCC